MRFSIPTFFLLLFIAHAFSQAETISLRLDETQIFEFDQTGWVSLTKDQQEVISLQAGFSPSRVRPIYHPPDGEVASLGYNLALRRTDDSIEVYTDFLLSDDDVKAKIQENKDRIGQVRASRKSYPSYLIDADGKFWMFISRSDFEERIRKERKNIGKLYIHMPTSFVDENTVASRDGLRQMHMTLKEINISSYEITKK